MSISRFFMVALVIAAANAYGESAQFRLFDRVAESAALEYRESSQPSVKQIPLEQRSVGVWDATLDLVPGEYEYRFVVDDQYRFSDIARTNVVRKDDGSIWSQFQLKAGERFFNVARPITPPEAREKYTVRIAYRDSGASAVKLAGEFNGWSQESMQRVRDGEWERVLRLREGDYAYKFVVDGKWLLDPENGERKSVNGVENSKLLVNASTAITESDVPRTLEPTGDEVVTVFRLYAPQADEVYLVGTFNNWNGSRDPMIRRGEMWETALPLKEGEYQFKFKSHDNWWTDPNHPPTEKSDGNSVIVIRRATEEPSDPVQFLAYTNVALILLEANTDLHAFQQELPRQYIRTLAQDGLGLKLADATLLRPDLVPESTPATWTWRVEDIGGRPTMKLGVGENTYAMPLEHPLLEPPGEWLATLRTFASSAIAENPFEWNGPTSPPPDSAWAQALECYNSGEAMGGVFAVNAMTAFGRETGWSRELCRDLAVAYAEMGNQNRFPSVTGWSPYVFSARAVVYADLAREDAEKDETMAYVLSRIGRLADGQKMLPDNPESFYGKIAAFMTRGDIAGFMEWVGSPDQYGYEAREDAPSYPSQIADWPDEQKAIALRSLADLLFYDDQETLSGLYLQASLSLRADDFGGRIKALARGGVSAGHRYASQVLEIAGCTNLWNAVLRGEASEFCDGDASRLAPGTPNIDAISMLYKQKRRELLDSTSAPIPEAARLILLSDQLNAAWWYNANFLAGLASDSAVRELNKLMSSWQLLQPEMTAFTRFRMRYVLKDTGYSAIRDPFERSKLGPDTFQYISLVRGSFYTWLMPKAQSFYPQIVYVQSDLLFDHRESWSVYVEQNMDRFRANSRRLAPMIAEGYPPPGPLPRPDDPNFEPKEILEKSYALNRRLGDEWKNSDDPEGADIAIEFYKRSMQITPYEAGIYRTMTGLLMQQQRYAEVLALVDRFPETTEGLQRVAMQRQGAFAAFALGDKKKMLSLAESAAQSWQAGAMVSYAFFLDMLGRKEESRAWYQRRDVRYNANDITYYWFRDEKLKEKALARGVEQTQWLEQFEDLDKANKEGRFSFNEFKGHPYTYILADRWDRALWLLKPLSEAVQNDYIWFTLMIVAQHESDVEARNLAQHVLADHVWNSWGEMARFRRNERGWQDVVISARNEFNQPPMNYFASILAEQRGDKDLALQLLKQILDDPYNDMGTWFTLAWQSLERLGENPRVFVARSLAKATPEVEE